MISSYNAVADGREETAQTRIFFALGLCCRIRLLGEVIPPSVFGSWETSLASCFPPLADFMAAVRGRKSYA